MKSVSKQDNLRLAQRHEEIPEAARRAFRAAYLRALDSKTGVVVASNGRLEHRWMIDGVIIAKVIGDVPLPLFVGIGARKRRARM
ncbi:hypothetical protein [Marinagarivorans cellulosilyticus]|uniref:Uncharacterized protein n=1 Tax=Marinagarivorans cellulosilyticus TaxID=2721545 RepID=A0AAN1WEN6_9GAMM|nr:hypothetical protein [Marinagarivorans cellulosilyticus]BCD96187.1 hypothetical protein MARGE09_P0386 [Marinagarivorans cellulosilyticus]